MSAETIEAGLKGALLGGALLGLVYLILWVRSIFSRERDVFKREMEDDLKKNETTNQNLPLPDLIDRANKRMGSTDPATRNDDGEG